MLEYTCASLVAKELGTAAQGRVERAGRGLRAHSRSCAVQMQSVCPQSFGSWAVKGLSVGVFAATLAFSGVAFANGFTVSPTSLKVTAGNQVATLTVKASGPEETLGQVRVVRWIRDGGQGKLLPTRDVVASPPALRMKPDQDFTVRLVRTIDRPVRGEECYRVLVDQLPGKSQDNQVVKFTIRHSVPLCFGAQN